MKSLQTVINYDDSVLKSQKLPWNIGNYRYEKQLGSGGFANVYQCENLDTKEKVAIKVISKSKIKEGPGRLNRLETEIIIMKICKDDNLIKYMGYFETPRFHHIVMEVCEGGDLESYIEKKGNKLTEQEAIPILKQIINGFRALHERSVIHRDIKAENILLKDNFWKIADFGLAKLSDSGNTYLGTPHSMAPEIYLQKTYTNAVDMWALGSLYYRMLFGCFAFDDFNDYRRKKKRPVLDMRRVTISEQSKDFILNTLCEDPSKRIQWDMVTKHPIFSEDPLEVKHVEPKESLLERFEGMKKKSQEFLWVNIDDLKKDLEFPSNDIPPEYKTFLVRFISGLTFLSLLEDVSKSIGNYKDLIQFKDIDPVFIILKIREHLLGQILERLINKSLVFDLAFDQYKEFLDSIYGMSILYIIHKELELLRRANKHCENDLLLALKSKMHLNPDVIQNSLDPLNSSESSHTDYANRVLYSYCLHLEFIITKNDSLKERIKKQLSLHCCQLFIMLSVDRHSFINNDPVPILNNLDALFMSLNKDLDNIVDFEGFLMKYIDDYLIGF